MTTVAATIYPAVNQSIPNAANTPVTFANPFNDPYGMFDPATHPTRLTAPVAGTYLVIGRISWAASASGNRGAIVLKNGGSLMAETYQPAVSGTETLWEQVVALAYLAAGDYIELEANQDSGGALNATANGIAGTSLSVALLGS